MAENFDEEDQVDIESGYNPEEKEEMDEDSVDIESTEYEPPAEGEEELSEETTEEYGDEEEEALEDDF